MVRAGSQGLVKLPWDPKARGGYWLKTKDMNASPCWKVSGLDFGVSKSF